MKTLLNTKQLNKHCLVSGCDICLIPLSPDHPIAWIVSWPLRPILRPSLISSPQFFFSSFRLDFPWALRPILRPPTLLHEGGGCSDTLFKGKKYQIVLELVWYNQLIFLWIPPPPLLNRREAPNFFDIREILKKKEAATDTPPLFFQKIDGRGGIHKDINW